jgi:hypothetical protein
VHPPTPTIIIPLIDHLGSKRPLTVHQKSDHPNPAQAFIHRWQTSAAAERANYALFLSELCDILNVPRPDPARATDQDNAYVFERTVHLDNGDGTTSVGRIDLYKRAAFVLEAKQGSGTTTSPDQPPLFPTPRTGRRGTAVRGTPAWDAAMLAARGQAEQYVRALPPSETNPPFIIIVDVGHTIELYADFSRLGKTYTPFPDSRTHRIKLADLADENIRTTLARVWTDPLSLDPSRHSAKVTRLVAEKLAKLAKSLEASGHHAEHVAHFLMRCLFTFFAEDALLIDRNQSEEQPFTQLLQTLKGNPDQFVPMVQEVWARMDAGGFSTALRRKLKHFNGKLFKECIALPLNKPQLDLLIEAGNSDWSDVEPAIFGTLLERALDERERHKLGAHYTPRAYVERLVLPTVIEPLREQWDAAKAAAFTQNFQGKPEDARQTIRDFLAKLCNTTVLDPACGSGNFLYVTMEHMKRLEGEARDLLRELGENQQLLERAGLTVDPHQFLGLEINPRAVAIAELVLWIGYLKWHLRTLGHAPAEPLLKDFHNIKEQDAVLAYDRKELVTDETGKPLTRWDGHTTKTSPMTGEEVPDESARAPLYRFISPQKTHWPPADYIIGNPPYIGARRIRLTLGDEYVETLRSVNNDVPDTSDFVMYWWHKAALAVGSGRAARFGFITTNSIVQSYSNGLIERHLTDKHGIWIVYAIPDHPWVEAADGADVRVAMTVCAQKPAIDGAAKIARVVDEEAKEGGDLITKVASRIGATLNASFDSAGLVVLKANSGMCFQGVVPAGEGFKLRLPELQALHLSEHKLPPVVKPYVIGRDLVQQREQKFIIDFFGLDVEEARTDSPLLYQRLLDRVYPERQQNKRASYKAKWWIFAEPRPALRKAIAKLDRFIVTPYTAKHRPFIFVDRNTVPDAMAYAVASDDAYVLGVLSSAPHVLWALTSGGRLGVGNDPRYTSDKTFLPFPFPDPTDAQSQKIRALAESLDAHRKRQQAAHPDLTITDMYNVLEKLRAFERPGSSLPGSSSFSEPRTLNPEPSSSSPSSLSRSVASSLSPKEKAIHEKGLISVLKQIHEDLDAAVADAYGFPPNLSDEQILQRLVALNHERAEEEKQGFIRYLRPEFQNPTGTSTVQTQLGLKPAKPTAAAKTKKLPWPKTLAEQAQALRAALAARSTPATPEQLAKSFQGARAARVQELLDALRALGQIRQLPQGRFAI